MYRPNEQPPRPAYHDHLKPTFGCGACIRESRGEWVCGDCRAWIPWAKRKCPACNSAAQEKRQRARESRVAASGTASRSR